MNDVGASVTMDARTAVAMLYRVDRLSRQRVDADDN